MRKTTIAERRAKAVIELANRTNGNINGAKKAMNAYYRLCGLEERLLYLENDEHTCNSSYCKKLQEQEERAIERVKKYFEEFNAVLIWFGYLPTICELGTTQDLYLAHFYN
jgi:hypothetical protein